MKKKIGTSIAVRPDTIVEARYSLTPEQNDFLDIFLTEIDDEDSNKLEYTLELRKYTNMFPKGKMKNVYRDLSKAVSGFENKGFSIISDSKKEHYAWFSKITYNNGEGTISLEIGRSFKEVLIQMRRAAYYNLKFPLSLTNIYSKRIYYMLKQYEDTGFRIDNLEDLRKKLECPDSYNKWSLFKVKVLDVAMREINNTDILVDYEAIYAKNKIVRIKFNIRKKNVIDGTTYTSLSLSETDYAEVIRLADRALHQDYKEEAERYVIWTSLKVKPEKIKTSKKAYLKKVIISDENKNEFMLEINQERKRRKNSDVEAELDKQWEIEHEETIKRKMAEHGVNTPEELNEKLAEMFSLNKA